LHTSFGGGLQHSLNQNFVVAADYGHVTDKRDGKSGLYIGLNWLFCIHTTALYLISTRSIIPHADLYFKPGADELKSKRSKRHAAKDFNVHKVDQTPYNEMMHAMNPGTYVKPHKHEKPDKREHHYT
jgi:hypothetical protein